MYKSVIHLDYYKSVEMRARTKLDIKALIYSSVSFQIDLDQREVKML